MILLCLAVSGFGLLRLTATPPTAGRSLAKEQAEASVTAADLPYRLVLSAEASVIQIASGDEPPLTEATGRLRPQPSDSKVVRLVVRWKNPPAAGEQRFAKLILEPAGRPTLTHVFDAAGDIDDILELP
jgi:hypothetical protein